MSEPALGVLGELLAGHLGGLIEEGVEDEEDGQVLLLVADQHGVPHAGELHAHELLDLEKKNINKLK